MEALQQTAKQTLLWALAADCYYHTARKSAMPFDLPCVAHMYAEVIAECDEMAINGVLSRRHQLMPIAWRHHRGGFP